MKDCSGVSNLAGPKMAAAGNKGTGDNQDGSGKSGVSNTDDRGPKKWLRVTGMDKGHAVRPKQKQEQYTLRVNGRLRRKTDKGSVCSQGS